MARNASIRRSAPTVALVLVCLFWYSVVASGEQYDLRTEDIFQAVARIMRITIREEIPRPRILVGAEVDPATFARLAGFDTGGKIFSAYFPEPNLIVLREWKRHTLAHEFVHYFQVKYQGYDPLAEGDTRDTSEREATAIELHFRDEERIGDGSRDSSH